MKAKKCFTCGIKKPIDKFGTNKVKPDGKTTSCKDCLRSKTDQRRRSLKLMIKGVPLHLIDEFKQKHSNWESKGFPVHLRPVLVGNEIITLIQKKQSGFMRKGTQVLMMKKGVIVQKFESIAHASRKTGIGHSLLKWLNDTGTEKNGFTYKIQKS